MAAGDTPAPPLTPDFAYDVAVVGLGEVGMPIALAYHEGGRSVLGYDTSVDRLISIGAGRTDLDEPHRAWLDGALTDDLFQLTNQAEDLSRARSIIVCVPTPVDACFSTDLTGLRAACSTVVDRALPGQLVVLTSATYVGCTQDLLVRPLTQRGLRVGSDVFVAFSAEHADSDGPEVRRGTAPRVVGGATPACGRRAVESLRGCSDRVHRVPSLSIAEMSKLLENSFRPDHLARGDRPDLRRPGGPGMTRVLSGPN